MLLCPETAGLVPRFGRYDRLRPKVACGRPFSTKHRRVAPWRRQPTLLSRDAFGILTSEFGNKLMHAFLIKGTFSLPGVFQKSQHALHMSTRKPRALASSASHF